MSIDTSVYYRLTTEVITDSMSGGRKNVVLEFVEEPPLPSGRMVIAAEARPYRGQFWKFVELTGQLRGRYHLVSASAGDAFHLVSDEFRRFISGNAILTQGNVIPSWSLDPNSDGTYCLSYDDQWGVRQHLAVAPATWSIKKTGQEYTPELYEYLSFSAIFVAGSPPANPPSRFRLTKVVPDLAGGTTVRMTLGPTDYKTYIEPKGTVKAVMLFVDFSDAPAGTTSASETANHLLGNGKAQEVYSKQSHNKFTLDVTVKSDRWRRMPKRLTDYGSSANKDYLTDALRLFETELIKKEKDQAGKEKTELVYQLVFIVAPREVGSLNPGTSFEYSPSINLAPGDGVVLPAGAPEIRHIVAFGADSYLNRFTNLVHEVGHQFGLPDLYPLENARDTLPDAFKTQGLEHRVGPWSIMGDMQRSESFLGWERHKMGWLNPWRIVYLFESVTRWETPLTPLSDNSGLSMVVLPLDDPSKPSKVLVVELAQPVYGKRNESDGKRVWDGTTSGKEGVLLYTVDASIPTGQFPIKIIPRIISKSDQYGQLYEAPWQAGDAAQAFPMEAGKVSITVNGNLPVADTTSQVKIAVRVGQKTGSAYPITIDYSRR